MQRKRFSFLFAGLVTVIVLTSVAVSNAPPSLADLPQKSFLPLVQKQHDGFVSPFGVSWYDWTEEQAVSLPGRIADLGGKWVLAPYLAWSDVEASPGGGYSWDKYDALYSNVSTRGLIPIVMISINPEWARAQPDRMSGPIKSEYVDNFVNFVGAAIARYSAPPYNVHYWMFYGEIDCVIPGKCNAFGQWGDSASEYADLLKRVQPVAKAAASDIHIVMGSLALGWFTDENGPFSRTFLDDVLSAGVGPYVDVLDYNYFPVQGPAWSAYGVDILGKTNYVKSRLSEHGVTSKGLIVSETFESGPVTDPVKLENQARYVPKVYVRGMSAGILNILWLGLDDYDSAQLALVHDDIPKPSYYVYQKMAAMLSDARFLRTLSPTDVGLTGQAANSFEGYAFRLVGISGQRWVVWSNTGPVALSLPQPSVEVVDKLGNLTHLIAGGDGLVRIFINESPVYLDLPM